MNYRIGTQTPGGSRGDVPRDDAGHVQPEWEERWMVVIGLDRKVIVSNFEEFMAEIPNAIESDINKVKKLFQSGEARTIYDRSSFENKQSLYLTCYPGRQ